MTKRRSIWSPSKGVPTAIIETSLPNTASRKSVVARAGPEITAQQILQVLLEIGRFAAIDSVHFRLVDVDANHVMTFFGKTNAGDQANVTGAYNRYFHFVEGLGDGPMGIVTAVSVFLNPPLTRKSSLIWRARFGLRPYGCRSK